VNIYLASKLFAHRRGRFLSSLLGAELFPEPSRPNSGMLLMIGEQFQGAGELQEGYLSWARQPGCALLLLPPYREGRLSEMLDWSIGFAGSSLAATQDLSLPAIVASEVVYVLKGIDGSSESEMGHLWSDHALNTRYWKAHVNSGLVAATTLPLWSISTLDHADVTREWLDGLYRQTGKVSPLVEGPNQEETPCQLTPHDYTVLVCCYGLDVTTPEALSECMRLSVVPIVNLESFDSVPSFDRLKHLGLLDGSGLTPEGLNQLKSSKYWVFAEHLKGAAL
jgi:hypothetical protein